MPGRHECNTARSQKEKKCYYSQGGLFAAVSNLKTPDIYIESVITIAKLYWEGQKAISKDGVNIKSGLGVRLKKQEGCFLSFWVLHIHTNDLLVCVHDL